MPISSRARAAVEIVGIGAVAPFVLLSVLDFPRVAFDIDHDLSSSASIEYFAARGVQFGVDLVQNVGPFGWVHQSSIYAGYLHPQKLALAFVTRAAFAALALWATTLFPSRIARVAWLAAIVAPIGFGAPSVDMVELLQEGWAYANVYLAALFVMSRAGRRFSVLASLPALALIAFLALQKHTLLAVGSFAVGAAMLERLQRAGDRSAFGLGASFLACIAALWMVAGQGLANLPAFLLGVVRFGGGYNEVMALASTDTALRLGASIAIGLVAIVALRTIGRTQGVGKTLLDAMLVLVVWKHGFVRADPAHVVIFFHASLALALLLAFATPVPRTAPLAPRIRRLDLAMAALVAALAVAGVRGILASFPGTTFDPARAVELWTRNLAWLRGPGWRTGELGADLRRNEVLYELPSIVQTVGRAPIDFFGHQPGWVLLNRMNYVPRPMPIPFAAANASLRRRNEAFYRSADRSPTYVLVQLDEASPRPVTLDDGLALGALLDNYKPVSAGGDLILLERNPPAAFHERAEWTPLRETTLRLGETLAIDAPGDVLVWLEADVRPTLAGRLRSIALRPAPISIVLDVEGRGPIRRRYAPSMGSSGFLVSPYVSSGSELARAYARRADLLDRVRSVRFEVERESESYFRDEIAVRLSTSPRPSAPAPRPAGAPLASEERMRNTRASP